MTDYRILLLGFDGVLLGSDTAACPGDAEAVAAARRALRTYAAAGVRDGHRRAAHLEAPALFPDSDHRLARRAGSA